MSIVLRCDRVDCDAAVEVSATEFASAMGDSYIGTWVPRKPNEEDESEAYGWRVERPQLDEVLHCPEHAAGGDE